jgi:hypothetical protein
MKIHDIITYTQLEWTTPCLKVGAFRLGKVKKVDTKIFNIGRLLTKYSEKEIKDAAVGLYVRYDGDSVKIDKKYMIVNNSRISWYD